MTRAQRLQDWFHRNLPQFEPGFREARAEDPERFDRLAEQFLGWAEGVLGDDSLETVARSYARFTTSVNFHQARYEATGSYSASSAQQFREELYDRKDRMEEYLWGVYLTFFLWPHHMRIARFYEERFLPRLPDSARIVELAFGHGGWGQWALQRNPGLSLDGVDISPSSVELATALARVAGLSNRTRYQQGDALAAASEPSYTAAICGFVIEHLEEPEQLYRSLASRLLPGGLLFLTGALTAAQEDHIYEFVHESELISMAEQAGFRMLEALSEGPLRTLSRARFLPRSMALILQRSA